MSAQTYETFLRGQAEKAQYGVVIIPARTALDMADFIEKKRANGTDINVGSMISKDAAIDFIDAGRLCNPNEPRWSDNEVVNFLKSRPSAQPDLSETYAKAVFTWLLGYQTRAAELKGRYTPYEVLSWVANDWRKEHERK